DRLVERTFHVCRLNFVLHQRRFAGCRGQSIPGLRIEAAGRLESVCLLEGGERLLIVAAGLAIDLAGGKVRAIEQYFLFYDRRSARSTRPALARRPGDLPSFDRLRIKCRGRG